ncbi:hypothetical protein JCM5296_001459 [Sporobolomyces johnsonii]
MPNPPLPPPPPAGSPPSLHKFPLHQPANAGSPLITCASSSGPLPNQTLANLRAVLVASRFAASARLGLRDENRRNLAERQAHDKRTAEEQTRVKEVERKRKREEDERRERDRVEKAERERAARETEERENTRRRQAKEEEDRREAERTESTQKKEKQRALDVLQIVQANEASRRKGDGAAGRGHADGDVVMHDGTSVHPTPSTSALPTPPATGPPVAKAPAKGAPSRIIASSPEPDEDGIQPKPPRHDKKKRKRDHVIDSDASESDDDAQPLLQKIRKLESQPSSALPSAPTSVPPTPSRSAATLGDEPPQLRDPLDGFTSIERKLKEDRFTKHSIPIKPPAPGAATAFYIPSYPLVPPKPPVVPPTPTPKRQADVSGDFSTAKPGQQIAHSTFTNWTEAYLRPFGEDDLAFLAAKPEDITPYIIPPLGKPYLDRWEEEDSETPVASSSSWISPLEPPILPRLRPDNLTEDALGTENVFLGPLSERLMAALALEEGAGSAEVDEDEQGRGEEDGVVPPKLPMDAVDLEERIKRELRYIGLLPEEEVDWSTREDDEVSSALRACQRLLQQQVELNESRKSVLMSIVKDRMAYQDYETARDAQERVIEAGWQKRQRTDNKKKKKGKDRDRKDRDKPPPAGGDRDDPSKQPVSLELSEAVEKRNALVDHFAPFWREEEPGRFFGIPERSVYEGLEAIAEEDEDEDQAHLAQGGQNAEKEQQKIVQ